MSKKFHRLDFTDLDDDAWKCITTARRYSDRLEETLTDYDRFNCWTEPWLG
jgi:hypothetical protein